MRILYANVIEMNAGWGIECFLSPALVEFGHQVSNVDYRKNRHRIARTFWPLRAHDAFFINKGDGFPLSVLRNIRCPRFLWCCDLLALRMGQPEDELDPVYDRTQYRLLRSGWFDHIFVRTQHCLETVLANEWIGPEHCSILSSACEPSFHRPLAGTQKDIDILFIGTLTPRRERVVSELSAAYPVTSVSAFGEQMVQYVNRAKIVLNIHQGHLPDMENRVHEALGCGSFLMTERLTPENPFSESELVEFDTTKDLVEKVGYYLAHPDEREAIAEQGRLAVLAGHTFVDRAEQIISTLSDYVHESCSPDAPVLRRNADVIRCAISEEITRQKILAWHRLHRNPDAAPSSQKSRRGTVIER